MDKKSLDASIYDTAKRLTYHSLDAAGIGGLFDFFQRHLLPCGLLVFSTHGERVIQTMLGRKFELWNC
jgi:hypothetical protein